jgi:hypothetical protein
MPGWVQSRSTIVSSLDILRYMRDVTNQIFFTPLPDKSLFLQVSSFSSTNHILHVVTLPLRQFNHLRRQLQPSSVHNGAGSRFPAALTASLVCCFKQGLHK